MPRLPPYRISLEFAKARKPGKLLFSAKNYHRLGTSGLFIEDDPIGSARQKGWQAFPVPE